MALINCPECGKEVSSKAKSCPNCAFPFDQNNDKKNDGLYSGDGVRVGFGMFVMLPLILVSLLVIVFSLLFMYDLL